MAGTFLKLRSFQTRIYEIVCTPGEGDALREKNTTALAQTRRRELQQFARLIGIEKPILLNGCDGFLNPEKNLVEKLVLQLRQIRPQVIILLSQQDYHHDHQISFQLGLHALELAFRNCLTYLGPHLTEGIILESDGLNLLPQPHLTVNTSTTHAEKMKAIRQAYQERLGENLIQFIDALARLRGRRRGWSAGEAFRLVLPLWYQLHARNTQILQQFVNLGEN